MTRVVRSSTVLVLWLVSACDTAETKLVDQHVKMMDRVAELEARVTALEGQVKALAEQSKPAAKGPEAVAPAGPTTWVVEITSGGLLLQEAPVTLADLEARLRDRRTSDPGLELSVKAAQSVETARVTQVLDAAKRAGVVKIGMATPGGEGKR